MHQLVPKFILNKIDADEKSGTLSAAVMFIDLSGFSSMADSLSQHGHHGLEVLAVVMQSIFEPLVRSIYSQSGFVVGYAGDSISAIFIDDNDQPTALQCASAAVSMQNYFTTHPLHETPFGSFEITARIGLASGEVIWEIFYSADKRKATYCFRGAPMDASAQTERQATPGEIWLHPSLYHKISANVSGEWMSEFFRMDGFNAQLPESIPPEETQPVIKHLELFFSQEIINLSYRGEFRPLVNVFIDIPTDIQHQEQLGGFIQDVFDLQARYGGFFLRPDFGDKGVNLLIFWGAPVAHENDIERALNFLLELRTKTHIPFSAGVSYQMAYAGFIGAVQREDYTGYGWGIALSARMMKSAQQGEIWVDEQVAQRGIHRYHLGEPEAREFKGFNTKQNVYVLLGHKESDSQIYHGTFQGRQLELEELANFAAPLWKLRFAGIMLITGDAGVGKSRLVHEFKESISGKKTQWALCQTDEIIRQSLNPLRYWLRRHFGIDNELGEEENREIFFQRIQRLAEVTPYEDLRNELIRTRSFLGALINLYWDNSLYSRLDAKARHENTFIALSVLIRCESLQIPLIIQIEDAHWFDNETREFFPYLVRTLTADETRIYPVAILATIRPEGEVSQAFGELSVRVLELSGLETGFLNQLANDILGGSVSVELIDFLQDRAEGNPFFVEQVLKYLSENDLLQKRDDTFSILNTRQVDLLSTDIQSILVARLDRLAYEVKNVVQSAAVLGREFEIRLLGEMLHEEALPSLIDEAQRSDIWIPLSEMRYIFRHALMRDAAYSMQLRSHQRKLHVLALEAIEKVCANDLDHYYGELAYHAERAYHIEKARKYLEQAGCAAQEQFQNAQALDYFHSALQYTPEDDLEKRYLLNLNREKILAHWDQREEHERVLDELKSLAETLGESEKLIETKLRRANYLGFIGEYRVAEEIAREVLNIRKPIERNDLIDDAFLLLCDTLYHQGMPREAIEKGLEGIERARQHGDPGREAELLNMIGQVLVENEPSSAHAYFEQAQEIFRSKGDIRKLLMPINNLGNLAGMQGDFASAQAYYEEALSVAREVGNRKVESVLLNNLGWISGLMGDFHQARALSEQNLRVCREVGERYTETYTLINLSGYTGAVGENEIAVKYAEQGLHLARQSGEVSGEAWALTYLGHALFDMAEYERAEESYQAAIRIRQELDQGVLETEPAAGSARANLMLGIKKKARELAERVMAFIQKDSNLEGTDQPIRVYLNTYLVLKALEDPRANSILEQGCEMLKNRAAGIADEAARQMFLEDVSFHRELVAAKKTTSCG